MGYFKPILALLIISASVLLLHQYAIISSETTQQIPRKLFAGQIHYSRIPVEYWQHRLQMVKSLGLNSLSVYIMWNYHQVERGVFDYSTGNKNLPLFLELAQKYDMKVLIRPGPYVCAEWDFGGFPARLLSIPGLVLRANNQKYLQQVKIYFESLVPIFKKHLYTEQNPKGCIVMLQIQNQYGFYGTDKTYIQALRKMWDDFGVKSPQYYVDWIQNILKCHWTGANIGINNGITQTQFDFVRTFERNGYTLGGQIYSGWLTHWYQKWQSKSVQKNQQQYGFLMQKNHSYSMYMVHGGTNFGLTAGANAFVGQKYNYRGHVTSYDYDAPITEQGSAAPKFNALRELIKTYADWDVPAVPDPINTMELPGFTPVLVGTLSENIGSPAVKNSNELYPFQSSQLSMFNQGLVVYQTFLTNRKYFFKAIVHDFALVQLDGQHITTLDRSTNIEHSFNVICAKSNCTLRIIVQATGHINFDHQMQNDYKGLMDIDDDLKVQFTWNMYKVPLQQAEKTIFNWNKKSSQKNTVSLLKSSVTLNSVNQVIGDTYLDMSKFVKGYVWVNGHNLGRYWNVGPQYRLFCPGVWFKNGQNIIYVLQLLSDQQPHQITGKKTLTD